MSDCETLCEKCVHVGKTPIHYHFLPVEAWDIYWYCKASPIENPVPGPRSEPYRYCRIVNTGNCPLFEQLP